MHMLRPDGPSGPLVLRGGGRDVRTKANGDADVVGAATLEVVVDYMGDRTVTSLASDPDVPELQSLVGMRAGSGFRRSLEAAVPALVARRALLARLIDEVPVTTLISRAAMSDSGVERVLSASGLPPIDVCAGWQSGGHLAEATIQFGRLPVLVRPEAPEMMDHGDVSWAEHAPLAPRDMRRIRRLDVAPAGDGDDNAFVIESMFRDSLQHPDEGHIVVHEYSVMATIDGRTERVFAIQSDARVLPGPECPLAASSGARLVGRTLAEVDRYVTAEFPGVTTCTHLNDHLRAFSDIPELLQALRA
jgi:hypothetical protein